MYVDSGLNFKAKHILHKGPCHVISKFNLMKNRDVFFFVNKDDSWIPADGSVKKFHKNI